MKISRIVVLMTMISLWGLPGSPSLRAEDHDLSLVAKHMEQHLQAKRTDIPLWGLLKHFLKLPFPGQGIDFALFDDQDLRAIDPQDLEKEILQRLGPQWQPIIRVRSRKEKEWTLICTKPIGKKFKMMIINVEPREAVVMKLNLHPKDLSSWMEGEVCGTHKAAMKEIAGNRSE